MPDSVSLHELYDKNIIFLFGSGASHGLFPTLALEIKGEDGADQTVETLASHFESIKDEDRKALLFMHYYKECIEPAMLFAPEDQTLNEGQKEVITNYEIFLGTILTILQRRTNHGKSCNIFTTNYDGCIEEVANKMLRKGGADFILNDGTCGFRKRILQDRNFNRTTYYTGIFNRHREEVPQINLIHLHGSVSWHKEDGDTIRVDYAKGSNAKRIIQSLPDNLETFSNAIRNKDKKISDLSACDLDKGVRDNFWQMYNALPIVNPTKWKFHETVFEEHYYQMLRHLSYELEKRNSVMLVFGFSFADEHIRNLIKRSLSNPTLQVFVCCYRKQHVENYEAMFKGYKNIEFITAENDLNFCEFNKSVFSLNTDQATQPPEEEQP